MSGVYIIGAQYSTFVRAVALCCEEKGINYGLGFDFPDHTLEYKGVTHYRLHPFGKVPILIHGERTIFESTTICRYLDSEFSGKKLQPSHHFERAQVDQWCAAISTYIDKALIRDYLLEFSFPKGRDGDIRWDKLEQSKPKVEETFSILNQQLGNNTFICGDRYSIADALLTPILDYLEKLSDAKALFILYPKLESYLLRMRCRKSGQKVLIAAEISS
ncbi:hypothetical protein GCM10007938_06330 [Vibrio zhanjiangensis]|uniref:glutathione transferase n=1 Tax=Vibrio zhanjiangensis TaxID=1046128 RepID=A0ABQ6EVX1_9VIBR|nr:glutathione S-transferase family protein [Vibrio zhanjiangensis]GLT16856.1 hypothetical protein GCM10007938_06330 [Vibrio zhanjiangensis]